MTSNCLDNKDVIITSLTNVDGVVRVVFATMALGMGIDCVGVNQTIHYGVEVESRQLWRAVNFHYAV